MPVFRGVIQVPLQHLPPTRHLAAEYPAVHVLPERAQRAQPEPPARGRPRAVREADPAPIMHTPMIRCATRSDGHRGP